MKVKVLEFFPKPMKGYTWAGTCAVQLVDLGVTLRGYFVGRRPDKLVYMYPSGRGVHKTTKLPCKFPIFAFDDRLTQMDMLASIRDAVDAYVEANPGVKVVKKSPAIKEFVAPPKREPALKARWAN